MPKYKSILKETRFIGLKCCKCGATAYFAYSPVTTKKHVKWILNDRKTDVESDFYGWTLNKKDEAYCNKCNQKNKK